MPQDNMYDNVPIAVATIVSTNTGFFIGTNGDQAARRQDLLDFVDKLTRTMVAAVAGIERPTFGK